MDSVVLWMDADNTEERIDRKIIRDKCNIMEMCDKRDADLIREKQRKKEEEEAARKVPAAK